MTPEEINAQRIAVGVCRHCGGSVPCWSPHGDQRVGVKHDELSLRRMRKERA